MIRRLPVAVVVLGMTIYWANCDYNPPRVAPPAPDLNSFFAGCYEGSISDPAGGGRLRVVLEDPGAEDNLTLTGCLQSQTAAGAALATLAGTVQGQPETAVLTAMPTDDQTPFTVTVVREPAGEVIAVTVDVTTTGAAGFVAANDLPRCTEARDCAALGIPLPFMPGGGAP